MSSPGTGRDPGDDADDVDARFAELVASLDDVPDLPGRTGPPDDDDPQGTAPDDDVPTGSTPEGSPSGPGLTYPVAPWVAVGPRDWDATSQMDDAERAVDEQETFVPPDPGPVMGNDPLATMAWLAAVGIPIALFVLFVFWRTAPIIVFQAGGIVCLLGVVALMWRLPAGRDPEDHDPGAVV